MNQRTAFIHYYKTALACHNKQPWPYMTKTIYPILAQKQALT